MSAIVNDVRAQYVLPKAERDLSAFSNLDDHSEGVVRNLGPKPFAMWYYLARNEGKALCRECVNVDLTAAGAESSQPAGPIRELRNNGFPIPKDVRVKCPEHDSTTADGLSSVNADPGESKLRWDYKPTELARMKEILGKKDAFGDRANPSKLEFEHRVPLVRWEGDEEPVDVSDEEAVKKNFQLLTRRNNLWKSRKCESCVATGTRPLGGHEGNIRYWFVGGERYEEEIGCDGCYLAYPEKWNENAKKLIEAGNGKLTDETAE